MATKTGAPSKNVTPNASKARAQEKAAAANVADGVESTLTSQPGATGAPKPNQEERAAADLAKQRDASAKLARSLDLAQRGKER